MLVVTHEFGNVDIGEALRECSDCSGDGSDDVKQ